MAQVHVDFEDLIDFQRVLRENSEHFRDVDERTKTTLKNLDWEDVIFKQFEEDFEEGMRPINALREKMEGEFIPWLDRKIAPLQQYHASKI
ncbi:MAG: hypothetical protein FWG84_01480 [Bacteroidales bacterium]|nr:hypothetical protein [Bacteroidales bacterium]